MTDPQSVDLTAFRAWEHAAWQDGAAAYDHFWGDLSLQAIGPLLDAVGARKGARLLDVATGPGYAAAIAALRGADAIGVDYSAAMVAEARKH